VPSALALIGLALLALPELYLGAQGLPRGYPREAWVTWAAMAGGAMLVASLCSSLVLGLLRPRRHSDAG
jgi:NhaP-type Na+/H+ or K+/H+ antiporter